MGKKIEWVRGFVSIYAATIVATLPLAAQAQGNLATLDRDMVGARSQILGTMHLNSMPKTSIPRHWTAY